MPEVRMNEPCIYGQNRKALLFEYDKDTIELIKQIEGMIWPAPSKFWHLTYQEKAIQKLKDQLMGNLDLIEQKNVSEFPPKYLETLKLRNYNEAINRKINDIDYYHYAISIKQATVHTLRHHLLLICWNMEQICELLEKFFDNISQKLLRFILMFQTKLYDWEGI
jgi:Na+/phosphate symporter